MLKQCRQSPEELQSRYEARSAASHSNTVFTELLGYVSPKYLEM